MNCTVTVLSGAVPVYKKREIQMLNKIKLRWSNFIENVQAGDKKARMWLIIYVGVILFAAVLVVGVIRLNSGYNTYEVLDIIDKNDDISVNYHVVGDGLIRYSKDGASYSDKKGKTLWNQTFEMANAKIASCDKFMAIADIGSNQLRIFNQAGQVAVIEATYPIANVDVSEQGVTAVILSASDASYINMYDTKGNKLVDIKVSISQTGYPMDFAISDDGTKLAVSYMVVNDGEISSKIAFYKFGKATQSADSNAVDEFSIDMIVPKMDFINNNTLVAFGDSGFKIYSMKDTPKELLDKSFEQEIKSVFYNEQYIGFVFKNNAGGQMNETDALSDTVASDVAVSDTSAADLAADGAHLIVEEAGETAGTSQSQSVSQPSGDTETVMPYKMQIYTNGGALYLEQDFDFEYHNIDCTENEIVMYNDYECLMMTYQGKEKFRYTFENKIYNLMPKKTKDEYILVDETAIQEIKLK